MHMVQNNDLSLKDTMIMKKKVKTGKSDYPTTLDLWQVM